MDVDEARSESRAAERNRHRAGGSRMVRAEARGDAAVLDEERTRDFGGRFGIGEDGAVEPGPLHASCTLVQGPPGDSTLKTAARRSDPKRVPNAPPPSSATDIAEDLVVLDNKIKQLKFEYDQYFIGSRPREPILTRGDVNKLVAKYSNLGIQNTSLRFKFNTLCSRFFAMRRQWDETLRKIEAGTYERHVFKAKLHERERGIVEDAPKPLAVAAGRDETTAGGTDLFEAYRSARRSCGEDVAGLSRAKLDQLVEKQRAAIQQKYGCQEVRFRVVVEGGKTKLKATPVKQSGA